MSFRDLPNALTPISDQYKPRMAYGTNPDPGSANEVMLYAAWALPGTGNGDARWRIIYMTYDSSDQMTAFDYPQDASGNESAEFEFEWDERASYTYGA